MYAYAFDSNPEMVGVRYGRVAQRSSGLAAYEFLGTTYAAIEDTTPETELVTPKRFSMAERLVLNKLKLEVLTVPTETEGLDGLVRSATEAWRTLLSNANVQRVWTDYEEVVKEVDNRTSSGLFIPLEDGVSPTPAFIASVFESYRATEGERAAISAIESNIVAMSADRTVPGSGNYL